MLYTTVGPKTDKTCQQSCTIPGVKLQTNHVINHTLSSTIHCWLTDTSNLETMFDEAANSFWDRIAVDDLLAARCQSNE